jgi:hypothetical protein
VQVIGYELPRNEGVYMRMRVLYDINPRAFLMLYD